MVQSAVMPVVHDGSRCTREQQQDDGNGGVPVDTPLDVGGVARTDIVGAGKPGPGETGLFVGGVCRKWDARLRWQIGYMVVGGIWITHVGLHQSWQGYLIGVVRGMIFVRSEFWNKEFVSNYEAGRGNKEDMSVRFGF